MDSEELTKLVMKSQAGDRKAFSLLVKSTYKGVYRVAYKLMGNRAEAEDVTQDASLKAMQEINTLKDPLAFPAWYRRIAFRVGLNIIRRRTRESTIPEGHEIEDGSVGAERQVIDKEKIFAVRNAIATLDIDYSEPIMLVDIEGMAYKDAADNLGISLANLKVRLYRARDMLKEKLIESKLIEVSL